MKNNLLIAALTFTAAATTVSCTKESSQNTQTQLLEVAEQIDLRVESTCDQFAYPDTIFYPAELPDDYIVRPLTPLQGTFGAYPDGLEINRFNGNIDITESETGLRYFIWFVATGSTDTCKKFITVSGINYIDSIYVLNSNPGVATPIYNADRQVQSACTGECEFDDGPDDDDGDGIADEPLPGQEVIPQGIELDKATGAINLKQSLINGALGPNPRPGAFKDFALNYRISDRSSKALNQIIFRLIYFKKQSQIPPILLNALQSKRKLVLFNEQFNGGNFPAYTINNIIQKEREVKCRPPYIIVVQN